MSITAISADMAQNPRTVRITTTDNFQVISAAGYLADQEDNIKELNSGEFNFLASDLCIVSYDGGEQLFRVVGDVLELIPNNSLQHVQVDVALADFIGSYTASLNLLPAPGENKKYVLHRATLHINYGGTVLAAGGDVQIQYADDANAGGTFASSSVTDTVLIAATADTSFSLSPVDTTLTDATTLNEGLYLSAQTADFTGGTNSSYKVDLWYSVMDVA